MEQPTENGTDVLTARANRLYWESERSVGRIADDLDVARGTLYGMIQPLAAGLACPECTTEMVYANRTARDRGLLACPGCGLVEDEELIRLAWEDSEEGVNGGAIALSADVEPGAPSRGASAITAEDGDRTLLGLAALGAAAGLALVFWLRRR